MAITSLRQGSRTSTGEGDVSIQRHFLKLKIFTKSLLGPGDIMNTAPTPWGLSRGEQEEQGDKNTDIRVP